MRISEHPILNFDFENRTKIEFTCDGTTVAAYEGETIAAALHAAGIKRLSHSHERKRPRGFYCAIGNCSSCMMVVDGEPNVRVCITLVRDGMVVTTQEGAGSLV